MTAAFGGNVLSATYKPLFTSPSSAGYKAMTWMVNAYKSGLVPKANLNIAGLPGARDRPGPRPDRQRVLRLLG